MKASSIKLFIEEKKYEMIVVLSGLIGLTASFALTLDKIKVLENPGFVPSCSVNPIISCTSAMSSTQASSFGIPNSIVGIVLYTALLVVGGSLLIGMVYSKRILAMATYGAAIGFLFTNYLILQSILVLHVVCPWCFTIWLSSPLILLGMLRLYMKDHEKRPENQPLIFRRPRRFIIKHIPALIALWYLGLFLLLAVAFREYWATVL